MGGLLLFTLRGTENYFLLLNYITKSTIFPSAADTKLVVVVVGIHQSRETIEWHSGCWSEVFSPGPNAWIWRKSRYPSSRSTPSPRCRKFTIKRQTANTIGSSAGAESARTWLKSSTNCLTGSSLGFLLEVVRA